MSTSRPLAAGRFGIMIQLDHNLIAFVETISS
ncbi:hypothetical protein X566_10105 [Afipia sp. P52-10]|nr:hypothetical protein X566_10105 [Afipia sp. P52-10]